MTFEFEASGKMKKPTAAAKTDADQHSAILSLMHGTTDDARPFYAYVAVKPSKYAEFYKLNAEKKTFMITDYGQIIKCGPSNQPPPEVVEEMREKYGFDDHYEEKVKEEYLKERKEFIDKQEVNRIGDIVAMLKKNQKPS